MYLKASYTIEASVILPIILMMFALSVCVATNMYTQEKDLIIAQAEYKSINPTKTIRAGKIAKTIVEYLGD